MEQDFSLMRHPLDKVLKKQQVISVYTDLAMYDCFKAKVDDLSTDKCLRYSILVADGKSPIHSAPSFEMMVDKALLMAGFEKEENGQWSDTIKSIIAGNNNTVNQMITQLFILYNDAMYEMWYTLKINYHTITHSIRKPPNTTDSDALMREQKVRSEIQKNLKEMVTELLKVENTLFKNPYAKGAVENITAQQTRSFVEELSTTGNIK